MDKSEFIDTIFSALRSKDVPYMVLRGFSDIPAKVNLDNDIDLLCMDSYKEPIIKIFKSFGFKYYSDSRITNQYLYQAQPHYHFKSKKADLHFDIVFNLAYKSPNQGEWVSVDQNLQDSIWNNMIKVDESWVFQPSPDDFIIHVLCHCIFDKKNFHAKHVKSIEMLGELNFSELAPKLELIFFKFTPYLIEHLKKGEYNRIIENYIAFSDY